MLVTVALGRNAHFKKPNKDRNPIVCYDIKKILEVSDAGLPSQLHNHQQQLTTSQSGGRYGPVLTKREERI